MEILNMKNTTSKNRLAFSLIELSVVILVIGILVIGITQGSRIIREAKLKSARALTASSPVAAIGNIAMWLESTSEKSFIASEKVNTALGSTGTISTWYDINPQSTSLNNATQGTANNKPRYLVNGINGLPAINFDGGTDFLNFNGAPLTNNNYTLFIVEQRRSGGVIYFIGGTGNSANTRLHLGYESSTTPSFRQYANDYDATNAVAAYSGLKPLIHTFWFNSSYTSDAKQYYVNSVYKTLSAAGSTVETQGLTSYPGATIGQKGDGWFFNGDIGEIIMFNKALTNSERTNIENYLISKWGI
jgi:prepilin-type N-terminal cleavage/methylation domain-containing protein